MFVGTSHIFFGKNMNYTSGDSSTNQLTQYPTLDMSTLTNNFQHQKVQNQSKKEPEMSIHNVALMRAINILNATKCQFKVIAPDGSQFGDLQIMQKKKTKRRSPGFVKHYFNVYNMKIGEVAAFKPDGEVMPNMHELKKVLSKHLYSLFGKGSAVFNEVDGTLEVMRIA
jgi:hypothetical protein